MKKHSAKVLVTLTTAICLAFSLLLTPVSAKQATESITVGYRDIKIEINGKIITPKDANGQVVEPFIYNGSTYLPIRAIGEALGMDVNWDNGTSTAILTSGGMVSAQSADDSGDAARLMSTGTYAIEVGYRNINLSIDGEVITPKDANGMRVEPFFYNGTTYLPIRAVGEALGMDVYWDNSTSTAILEYCYSDDYSYPENPAVPDYGLFFNVPYLYRGTTPMPPLEMTAYYYDELYMDEYIEILESYGFYFVCIDDSDDIVFKVYVTADGDTFVYIGEFMDTLYIVGFTVMKDI
jgi:hypothetical protein